MSLPPDLKDFTSDERTRLERIIESKWGFITFIIILILAGAERV